MNKFKVLHLLLALNFLFLHAALSETQLQFVSFPKSSDAKPVELLIGEGETISVEIPTNSISPVYKVNPLSKWVIGKSTVDENGERSFDIYGQSPSINSNKQLILVFRKGKKDADGFKLIPINYNPTNFGGGEYFLINSTKVDIAGSIGSGKFSLKPNKYTKLAPKPTKSKNGKRYAFTAFFYKNKENIQPFFSSTWRFNENARTMVFFYHDPKTSHLKLHTIRSYLP